MRSAFPTIGPHSHRSPIARWNSWNAPRPPSGPGGVVLLLGDVHEGAPVVQPVGGVPEARGRELGELAVDGADELGVVLLLAGTNRVAGDRPAHRDHASAAATCGRIAAREGSSAPAVAASTDSPADTPIAATNPSLKSAGDA
jgi:hypothetical protein